MRILLFTSLLLCVSCSKFTEATGPKFKVGDCFAMESDLKDTERWEKGKHYFIEKVLEVGKKKYRTAMFSVKDQNQYLPSFAVRSSDMSYDRINVKVDCLKFMEPVTASYVDSLKAKE